MALYSLHSLVDSASHCHTQAKDGSWIPVRPENYKALTLAQRIKNACAYLRGEVDLVKWPESREDWPSNPAGPECGPFIVGAEGELTPEQVDSIVLSEHYVQQSPAEDDFFADHKRLTESAQKLALLTEAVSDASLKPYPEDMTPQQRSGRTRTIHSLIGDLNRYTRKNDNEQQEHGEAASSADVPLPSINVQLDGPLKVSRRHISAQFHLLDIALQQYAHDLARHVHALMCESTVQTTSGTVLASTPELSRLRLIRTYLEEYLNAAETGRQDTFENVIPNFPAIVQTAIEETHVELQASRNRRLKSALTLTNVLAALHQIKSGLSHCTKQQGV